MKLKKLIITLTIFSVAFSACTKRLDSLLNDPNSPSLSTADVDLFLNAEQLNFNGFWSGADWLRCRDGKWRPTEPTIFPLATGVRNRVGTLCGSGNAINIPTAEAFIRCIMEG